MRGDVRKYRTGRPEQWLRRDLLIRTYYLLPPDSPQGASIRGTVERFKQETTPGWRHVLELDELERERARGAGGRG
jgi:hypothetical protein